LLLTLLAAAPWYVAADEVLNHEMSVELQPDKSHLRVKDRITLPKQLAARPVHFILHGDLDIQSVSVSYKQVPLQPGEEADVPLKRYSLQVPQGTSQVYVVYSGKINHRIEGSDTEYARSFSETPGLIGEQGVFLANSTVWYPLIEDQLVSFSMEVSLPEKWTAISQGKRIRNERKDSRSVVTWQETHPQDDIYLVAGRFTEYHQSAGSATAMVYLREDDAALAQKYLDTTAQYLAMYSKLIGPYPYAKFAMVENFWETGYGMPSFTLLGPKVLRFPFILHSSYPHEILHNWWGNGVYVNYQSGNWAEGLTAYLADHLIKQQRGRGAEYRRSVLQKYTDFVDEERDFPLTEFRSRHSASTEAVGYGKTMMLYHMLRQRLGDEDFVRALRRFYRRYQFKVASFSDVEKVFDDVSEKDIKREFNQWVRRAGAPKLEINTALAEPLADGFRLSMEISQTQPDEPYDLFIPMAVHLRKHEQAFQTYVVMEKRRQQFTLELPARPLRVDVDPQFDVFRRLDAREIPAALSQGFGAQSVLVLLPSGAGQKLLQSYRKLAEAWQKNQEGKWEIALDSDYGKLPVDRAVWLLGWENRFRESVGLGIMSRGVDIAKDGVSLKKRQFNRKEHSVLLTMRHPKNVKQTVLWLANDNIKAMPGLSRKLPHYRKYSYLAFSGDEPTNIAKGQWEVLNSPMRKIVTQADGEKPKVVTGELRHREALAQLPPAFSENRMMEDINYLAGESMAGRELGSAALNRAADYIANVFKKAGLQPGGSRPDSYFQTWKQDVGKGKGTVTLKNVIGVLPGNNSQLQGQSLIVSAHYDHLGKGWPDVHKGDKGKIHYGADDNASGVAVMLELIRQVSKKWRPERTIVFVAFSGEEAGLLGSQYYAKHPGNYPLDKIIGVINLDTVGRLGSNPVTVFGTGSAREWVHIFRGAGFVTGIAVKSVADDYGFSDQKSFIDKGVPGVQFFGSVHRDYHRPGDTADKVDSAGLVKVAAILKEAVEYLANRKEMLNVTLNNAKPTAKSSPEKEKPSRGRKVSVGTVPDFTYRGKGVRITDTVPQSPARAAGLKAGDVLIRMNGKAIKDLSDYAAILRAMQPGDRAELVYLRDGDKHTVKITVKHR
jgi:hypothetical protein